MALRIYDTLTRQKREFAPLHAGQVRMYVCGPTVYAKAHVGHAMSAVVFDVIRRYLEHRGHAVTHVMNYTDVEDKILLRARELGVDPMQLAEGYIQEYDAHLKELHVLPASQTPRASREIPAILEMIQKLVDRGAAYPVDGDVYFRVATDSEYGKLSGRKPEDMRAGARIEVDERKEDPADFALWKAAKPGEPSWPSPWGPGRPGWHIECSAMIRRHLGEQIDIHGGGNDLIFPHHENEIAQSETLTGKPFARFWIHNGMLQFSDEKMSKSLGNVVTVEEFLQRHEGDALRMLVLNSGYRKPLTFSEDVVGQSEAGLERLRSAARTAARSSGEDRSREEGLHAAVESAQRAFEEAMDDDFNTPEAIAHLFSLSKAIQVGLGGASDSSVDAAKRKLVELMQILGLQPEEIRRLDPAVLAEAASQALAKLETSLGQLDAKQEAGALGEGALSDLRKLHQSSDQARQAARHLVGLDQVDVVQDQLSTLIDLLLGSRTYLRKLGEFEASDEIRRQLESHGIVLEDSKDGTTHWRPV